MITPHFAQLDRSTKPSASNQTDISGFHKVEKPSTRTFWNPCPSREPHILPGASAPDAGLRPRNREPKRDDSINRWSPLMIRGHHVILSVLTRLSVRWFCDCTMTESRRFASRLACRRWRWWWWCEKFAGVKCRSGRRLHGNLSLLFVNGCRNSWVCRVWNYDFFKWCVFMVVECALCVRWDLNDCWEFWTFAMYFYWIVLWKYVFFICWSFMFLLLNLFSSPSPSDVFPKLWR